MAASQGCSGAELAEAVVVGLYWAFDQGERALCTEDILGALQETVPLSQSRAVDLQRLYQWAAVHARPAQATPHRRS